jgi:hypothetical protein
LPAHVSASRTNPSLTQLANAVSISLRYPCSLSRNLELLLALGSDRSMTADDTTSLIAKAFVRGGPIRGLVLGGVLLIAAIMVGTTIMAGNFRERALNSSERELENTVLLLARHFDQQMEDSEVIQKDLSNVKCQVATSI